MMKRFMSFLLCCLCLQSVQSQTKVVLKLDDIGARGGNNNAEKVMQYLLQRGVKASYGVIADRLDSTAGWLLGPFIAARDNKGQPMVEFWNHGLHHNRIDSVFEFKRRSFNEQFASLDSAHSLVKKYLGLEMQTFGAPFNAADTATLRALAAHPGYYKVFFSSVSYPLPPRIRRLNNQVAMEKATGKPDFEYFLSQWALHPDYLSSNIILQGHPPYWSGAGFAEFKKILDFLDNKHSEYILPSDL